MALYVMCIQYMEWKANIDGVPSCPLCENNIPEHKKGCDIVQILYLDKP